MTDTTRELLHEAIARNAAAVISLPSAGMLRHHRTRFLAMAEAGFYIESIAGEARLIDELIESQEAVGVAFKANPNKIVFAVPISKRQPDFRLNKEMSVEALLLPLPRNIKSVQRRASYRVQIPDSCEISVRIWRIAEHTILRDRPAASMEIPARMRDLSVGGMAVHVPADDGKPISLADNQRLRVLITYAQNETLLEGRVRHAVKAPDNSLRFGVQFKKLQDDIEGRQMSAKLNNIVGELHRAEVRRMRLGLAG